MSRSREESVRYRFAADELGLVEKILVEGVCDKTWRRVAGSLTPSDTILSRAKPVKLQFGEDGEISLVHQQENGQERSSYTVYDVITAQTILPGAIEFNREEAFPDGTFNPTYLARYFFHFLRMGYTGWISFRGPFDYDDMQMEHVRLDWNKSSRKNSLLEKSLFIKWPENDTRRTNPLRALCSERYDLELVSAVEVEA